MSLLFKNLRLHQVFGANTDVGKTILTSALVRASASLKNQVYYLKPVSTGPMKDADDEHVLRYAGAHKQFIKANCLFRFDEPLSPHLAAQMASEKAGVDLVPPSDETFVTSVATYIRRCATQSNDSSHMYVETAGGVHSPTLSGTTQLDSYRPLFLPTILIGDSRLGGISSTISSYESLLLRGYIIDAILLFKDDYYRNFEYLTPYFAERGVHVSAFDPPPPLESDPSRNFEITDKYYGTLVPSDQQGGIFDIQRHLDKRHAKRISELESMPQRTLDTVWWPFVQHGLVKGPAEVNVIDSASQDFFSIYNGHKTSTITTPDVEKAKSSSLLEPQYDGSSSWWTQALGHAHPSLTLAAARASGRYGHVMFPQATHLPALQLSEFLVHKGPGKGWASRAFISDNGSTGMEVALKMALRAYTVRHGTQYEADGKTKKALGIIGLKGSYHGDTIGAMDACEEGVYTCEWHQAKGYWFDPPSISIRNGEPTVTVPPAPSLLDCSIGARPDSKIMATNTTCAPVDADIAALLGPPLIGSFVGWGLFGISVMQTYFYYLSFPEDPILLKTYVYGMFTLELFHTIIISVGTWDSVIQGWGNLEFIIFGGWTYASIPVISGIAGAFAQGFFAWRIYVLGRRSRTWLVVVASIMVLSVTQMSGGIAAGVVLAQRNDQVSEKERLVLANLWLAGSAACDILIALSLTFLLWRARQKSREAGVVASRSDVILTRLITMTAETGATTAIIQVVDLILFLVYPAANYHEATAYILSKLYYNSLIASLNSRASIFRPEPSAYSSVSGMVYTQQSSSQNGMRVRRATGQSGIAGPVVHVTTYTEDDRSRMADDGDRKRGEIFDEEGSIPMNKLGA